MEWSVEKKKYNAQIKIKRWFSFRMLESFDLPMPLFLIFNIFTITIWIIHFILLVYKHLFFISWWITSYHQIIYHDYELFSISYLCHRTPWEFLLCFKRGLFYRGISGNMGGSELVRLFDYWRLSYVKRKECSLSRGAGKHNSKRNCEMC